MLNLAPMPGSSSRRPPGSGRLSLSLALQGGGAHGAFTWGVLDRLLEEEWGGSRDAIAARHMKGMESWVEAEVDKLKLDGFRDEVVGMLEANPAVSWDDALQGIVRQHLAHRSEDVA